MTSRPFRSDDAHDSPPPEEPNGQSGITDGGIGAEEPDGDDTDDRHGDDLGDDEEDDVVSEPLDDRLVVRAGEIDREGVPAWLDDSVLASDLELATSDAGVTGIRAAYAGGGDNGYARVQVTVDWDEGDTVEYGMRFRLPSGFLHAQQGAVDLIRWDNWSLDDEHPDHGGLALGSDGRLRLIAEQRDVEPYRPLLDGVEIPEDEWIEVRVRQTLSPSPEVARNELWLNDERVGLSSRPNASGRPITVVRAGLVSLDSGSQREPLELLFDEVSVEPAIRSGDTFQGR